MNGSIINSANQNSTHFSPPMDRSLAPELRDLTKGSVANPNPAQAVNQRIREFSESTQTPRQTES
ncbi:MAG: hypothetical protein KJ072_03045 [Verrucomicrobia bacterium]|nr:hypothetical protein [Verrucomicrobiota bacterium]